MYALLDERSRASYSLPAFRRAYARSAATATVIRVAAGEPEGERDGSVEVPVAVHTRVFGPIKGRLLVPVRDEQVAWDPSLTFPGMPAGTRLSRRSRPPVRATLLARDGEVLAEGGVEARSSPLGGLAASVAGVLAPATRAADRAGLYARGFPRDWPVGQNGLERAFEGRLAGVPGGELGPATACSAARRPRRRQPVRTTIDTDLQEAAVAALAGRLGGIAAIDPRTGEIRALAGIAFSAPQPPGSTFKIVTATAALEARAVRPSTMFPVETAAIVDGVELENANGEFCGGSFRDSFAHSCNSVFAPLGVKIGARRLVDAALRYGWNAPPVGAGRGAEHDPAGRGDRDPARGGVHRHRPGEGAGHAAAPRLGGADGGVRRGAHRAEPGGGTSADQGARHVAAGGAHAREPDARRWWPTAPAPRRRSREWRWPARRAPRSSRTRAGPRPRRSSRRTTDRTPTPGSPPTRRRGARG